MGFVYAEVELTNAEDIVLARRHIIGEDEVRRMPVTMLVDTGAYMLAINESTQEPMKFPVEEKRKAELANGHIVEYDVVSQVEI